MYVSPERDRYWKYDSLLGWVHQPGQEGVFETPQFRTTVQINSQGLRDQEYSYERSDEFRRILVLGDSFAWGYGVEAPQRFSELLESSLDAEVINAGVSGYSTDQELLWFKNEGIKYLPDLVILVFAGNDIGDNERQLVNTIYYKPMYVMGESNLELNGYPVPQTSLQGKFIYNLSQRSALFYFLVQRYFDLHSFYRDLRFQSDVSFHPDTGSGGAGQPFELTMALIREIRDIAASNDASFIIVATDSWWNGPPGWTYSEFIDTLHAEGFIVLDVKSIPGFIPEKMLIPDDGHWNSAGHQFVAGAIEDFIDDHQELIHQRNQDDQSGAH